MVDLDGHLVRTTGIRAPLQVVCAIAIVGYLAFQVSRILELIEDGLAGDHSEHSTPGTSPRNKKMTKNRLTGSVDVAGDPAVPNSAAGTDSNHEADASGHEASGARGSALPAADSKRLTARVGWVTLLKDGHKLVTSRVQESASHRQQSKDQWARRLKTDRQRGSLQDSGASSAPNVALEKSADPSGIGFAFGGISPGTLHAHGKLVEKHTVSYSIGLVGEYLLHVRFMCACGRHLLRCQARPFDCSCSPTSPAHVRHASSCRPTAGSRGSLA